MISKTIVIENPAGLHVRSASLFVQKATAFSGTVNVIKGTTTMDGKSIMGLIALAVAKGEEISLQVDGELETDVLQELGEILTAVDF